MIQFVPSAVLKNAGSNSLHLSRQSLPSAATGCSHVNVRTALKPKNTPAYKRQFRKHLRVPHQSEKQDRLSLHHGDGGGDLKQASRDEHRLSRLNSGQAQRPKEKKPEIPINDSRPPK